VPNATTLEESASSNLCPIAHATDHISGLSYCVPAAQGWLYVGERRNRPHWIVDRCQYGPFSLM
jgi:hypothetical protein